MSLATLGIIFIFVGFALALIVVVGSMSGRKSSDARGGAVVIVGPFPIVFGSDKHVARALLAFSIALVVVLIVLFLIQSFL